jgi:phage-related protein
MPDIKPLIWLSGSVKTPPFSKAARLETGFLLRQLQRGRSLGLPSSLPMSSIGTRCHELRINDRDKTWRIIYRIDENYVVIVDVFAKTTNKTPKSVIDLCKQRLKRYDEV